MSLSLDLQVVPLDTIAALKTYLQAKGYTTKVMLDGSAMEHVSILVRADDRYRLTPPDELRYMEGLLDLPLGFMNEFGFILSDEYRICACGRTPSALDVVHTAVKQGIHDKALVRDTILGPANIFEMASVGRPFACINCGNRLVMEVYHHLRNYLYA